MVKQKHVPSLRKKSRSALLLKDSWFRGSGFTKLPGENTNNTHTKSDGNINISTAPLLFKFLVNNYFTSPSRKMLEHSYYIKSKRVTVWNVLSSYFSDSCEESSTLNTYFWSRRIWINYIFTWNLFSLQRKSKMKTDIDFFLKKQKAKRYISL